MPNLESHSIDYIDLKSIEKWITAQNLNKIEEYLRSIPIIKYRSYEFLINGFLQYIKYKNIIKSEKSLNKSYNISKNNINFLNIYLKVLIKIKYFDKALKISNRIVLIDPNKKIVYSELYRALILNEEYNIAYKTAKKMHKISSSKKTQLMVRKLSPIWWKSLRGKKITLSRIKSKHKDFLLKARKNSEFQHHYNIFTDDSRIILEKDIKLANKPPLDIRKIEWIIEKDNEPIGIAGLVDLDMQNSRAEILIGFPGKKMFGDSLEAILLILEFAFCKINLTKVISYVYSDNPYAQRNTLKIGFKQEGFLESHIFDIKSNSRLGLYVNGYLNKDFFGNKKVMMLAKRFIGRDLSLKTTKYNFSKYNI